MNDTRNTYSEQSQIIDLEGIPELFDTLTMDLDDDKWTTYRYPIKFDASNILENYKLEDNTYSSAIKKHQSFNDIAVQLLLAIDKNVTKINCTVIYLNECITLNKCQKYCDSVGAKSCRWFYDGCCECIGSNCINYGINKSKCSNCPEIFDEDEYDLEDDENDDWLDYPDYKDNMIDD